MRIEEEHVFPVYILEDIINEIVNMCKGSKLEIMGQLIGHVYKYNGEKYIIIHDSLYIKGAIHSEQYGTASVEGALGEFETRFQEIREEKGDKNLRRVGWWHSHPGFTCFLSSVDLQTQKSVFPESHEVALVVDPVNDYFEFFTLDNEAEKEYKSLDYAIISSSN